MLEILNAILNLNTIILVIGFSIGFYNYNYNRSDIYNTIVVYFFISLIFDIISLIFSLFFEDLIPKYLYTRSEEHTSELQSRENLVCRLLLEKKKQNINTN